MCIIVIKRNVRAQLSLKCVIIIFTTNTRLISLSTLIRTSMKKNKHYCCSLHVWWMICSMYSVHKMNQLYLGIYQLIEFSCFIPQISFVLFFGSNSMGITVGEKWMVWENSTYCSRSAYGFSQSIHWNSMRSSSSLSRSGSMNELLWSLLLCCKSFTDPQSSSLAPLCWEPEINSKNQITT